MIDNRWREGIVRSKRFEKEDSCFFRFIAIMLVITAHYSNYLYEINGSKIWDFLNKSGRYGVSLFFLVSGYGLIQSGCGREINYHFVLHRIKRVYLPFVFMQLLALIYVGIPGSQMNAKDWFFYFLGTDYWYILVIMCLYGCFYIAIRFFDKYKELMLFFLVSALNIGLALMGCEEWWYLTNYVFNLGVFLAIHKGDDRDRKISEQNLAVLCGAGFVAFSVLYAKTGGMPHSIFKIMAAVCFAGFLWFFYESIPFHICIRPLNYIGKCSLYIYVLHTQALGLMRKYHINSYIVIALSVPAVIVTAVLYQRILSKLTE